MPELPVLSRIKSQNPTLFALLGGPFLEALSLPIPGPGGLQSATFIGKFTQYAPSIQQSFGARIVNVYKDGASTGITTSAVQCGFDGTVRNTGNTDLNDVFLKTTVFSGSTELRHADTGAFALPVGTSLPIAPPPVSVLGGDLPGDVTALIELRKGATGFVLGSLKSGKLGSIVTVTAVAINGSATSTILSGVRVFQFTGEVVNGGDLIRAFSIQKQLVVGGTPYVDTSNPPTGVTLGPMAKASVAVTFSISSLPLSARGLVEVLITVNEAGVPVKLQKFSTAWTIVTEEKAEITGVFTF